MGEKQMTTSRRLWELAYITNKGCGEALALKEIAYKIKRWEAIEKAAEAFLAEPPDDMKDSTHFNQCTTAKDCRALTIAFRVPKGGPF